MIVHSINLSMQQEGATKEDIERLPKYKFRKLGDFEKQNGEIQESFGGIMTECDTDSPIEHVLPPEDAVSSLHAKFCLFLFCFSFSGLISNLLMH